MKNTLIGLIVIGILGGITYLGMSYPSYSGYGAVATSTPGVTFNSAKFAAVIADLRTPGSTGTSTSVYNSDATDRYVSGWRIGCQGIGTSYTAVSGVGLAGLTLTIGTSTTASPSKVPSYPYMTGLAIATSSTNLVMASSTNALVGVPLIAIWPAGTYMTFWANATNTASCTFGVDYFGS